MNDQTIDSSDSVSAKMQTALAAFRQIGLPLMQALAEVNEAKGDARPALEDPSRFNALVDSAIALSRDLAKEIGGREEDIDVSVRWALAGSASQAVASSFRATGKSLGEDEIKRFVRLVVQLQDKLSFQMPSGGESVPNTVATFRAKMMEGLVPIIGAVAQYAFGRAEHDLLAEIAERIVKMADRVTRTLVESGATPEQWRLLCWNVLRAAGQIYAECHYAEADRLLYMEADERADYFAKHGNEVPMTQVWQAFNQRMAMLATLATYLRVPSSAALDEQGW